MKQLLLPAALIAALAAPGPAPAQDDGLGLGLEGLLDEFRRDLDPLLRDFAEGVEPQLRGFVSEMGPLLTTLADLIGDYNQYHPPEKLPNGDIIIRRRTPEEMRPEPDADPAPDGQIDL